MMACWICSWGQAAGTINHYEQAEEGSDTIVLQTENFNGIHVGSFSNPWPLPIWTMTDYSIFLSEDPPELSLIMNRPKRIPRRLHCLPQHLAGLMWGQVLRRLLQTLIMTVCLISLWGKVTGTISHYEQTSVELYDFTLLTNNFLSVDAGASSKVTFGDLDNDGLLDLLIGEYYGSLNHYEQETFGTYNFIQVTETFQGIGGKNRSLPGNRRPE